MKIIKSWKIDKVTIEILHESGQPLHKARWEFRIDGEVRMYGSGTPRSARDAVYSRRKLPY